jgi:hypothetical protein
MKANFPPSLLSLLGALLSLTFASAICAETPPAAYGTFPQGVFVGLEPLPANFGERPSQKWYHQIMLTLEGTKAKLDAVPIYFENGKKFWSASDGGFWVFEGRMSAKGEKFILDMKLTNSDYSRIEKTERQWDLVVNPDGTLTVDKVVYKRKVEDSGKK